MNKDETGMEQMAAIAKSAEARAISAESDANMNRLKLQAMTNERDAAMLRSNERYSLLKISESRVRELEAELERLEEYAAQLHDENERWATDLKRREALAEQSEARERELEAQWQAELPGLHLVTDADMKVLQCCEHMMAASPAWLCDQLPTLHRLMLARRGEKTDG